MTTSRLEAMLSPLAEEPSGGTTHYMLGNQYFKAQCCRMCGRSAGTCRGWRWTHQRTGLRCNRVNGSRYGRIPEDVPGSARIPVACYSCGSRPTDTATQPARPFT